MHLPENSQEGLTALSKHANLDLTSLLSSPAGKRSGLIARTLQKCFHIEL